MCRNCCARPTRDLQLRRRQGRPPAARRALEACLPHVSDNKTIKFLFLPTEHDPDSYRPRAGAEAFEQEMHDAMPLSQFLLQGSVGEHDLATPEGRARTQFDAKPLLQAMTPSALRLQIVRGLAQHDANHAGRNRSPV